MYLESPKNKAVESLLSYKDGVAALTERVFVCVWSGNGAVGGKSLSIRLIDGSNVKVINPSALHTHMVSAPNKHTLREKNKYDVNKQSMH